MAKKEPKSTQPEKERAFLVGVFLRSEPQLLGLDDSLAELRLLADTAGLNVVGESTQNLDQPHPDTYIGSGKVEEIKALAEETLTDVVIFDTELSPRHQRELEEKFQNRIRVLDRTALILDIFAQHASTREGILQVELAQYEYRLPRLTRAWTHLARQAGGASGRSGSAGGVGLRGPGETQLEVDRREIRTRISSLKAELEKVRAHRSRYRSQRKRSQIPIVALVGYTNAGKSTLLNYLSHSNVYVANQLFATLDPTTRRVQLPDNHWVLFTDTVGFIQKLPTQLIAAFRATLEEITEADLLLHMVDITHPNALAQWKAVQNTLVDINADHIPVITAMNKIDLLPNPEIAQEIVANTPLSVAISAKKGTGIADMLTMIEKQLYETQIPIQIRLPYQEGQLISLIHEQGHVSSIHHERNSVTIHGSVPGRLYTQFQPYLVNTDTLIEEE
ncbi:MAG TPA: GTPase HflX [Anaerolineaceae bacterium]|nr:GTPase HflX [Anaerolineaceae bacterium]HNZ00110.1 GTPase HflX [Anaerolineaceae bacterium]HOD43678.1 GTPase HflX [Anaerolineaceae bacterium]HOH20296.1 GTPase HflX [Anaerolineaceae bacterium]HOU43109.1 GTPase HflX [Anaerolineaceae bacterium]